MALLTVKNLSYGYDSQAILTGLNFSVETGDYLCIVGENGSGKTTLMKTLLGLREPMSGEIIPGDGLKHNEIGYLPQQTSSRRIFLPLSGRSSSPGFRDRPGSAHFTTVRKRLWQSKT